MSVRSIEVTAYGRSARVDVSDESAERLLIDRLPPGFALRSTEPEVEPERSWTAASRSDLLARVLPELELWVAEWAHEQAFVHAGCVAWRGRAVVIPGRSHAGKSTLTAALLRRGAAYMSDEYAVLGLDGRVHAYPRRLRMRRAAGWSEVSPADLGSAVEMGPLPLSVVARLTFDPDGWRITRVSRARGALEMLDNTVCARSRPETAMSAVAAAVQSAVVVTGTRGEADDAAGRLLDLADQQIVE